MANIIQQTERERKKKKKKIDGPLQMVKIVSVFPSRHGPNAVMAQNSANWFERVRKCQT
jgi:hypothetical protein